MRLTSVPVHVLGRCCKAIAYIFARLSSFFYGLLPVLMPPEQLSTHVAHAYNEIYAAHHLSDVDGIHDSSLDSWELSVLDKYKIDAGRMLVLGAGLGREALAIARRGVTVMGMDISYKASQVAQRRARTAGMPAQFHQASLFELPYKPCSFDYAIYTSSMYSSIPGKAARQSWLQNLRQPLKGGALIILSFASGYPPPSKGKMLRLWMNDILRKLPGANRAYQPGDSCLAGHFMHEFQTEDELRTELTEAGAVIQELCWTANYTVVTFPAPPVSLSSA